MKKLEFGYEDKSGLYWGAIRDEYGFIESATTGAKTVSEFKEWCHEHNITRQEWLDAERK